MDIISLISLTLSMVSLALNSFLLYKLIKLNKTADDLLDCYIDVNEETLMRETK